MPIILAIESSCDETSAAVLNDRKVLSNIIATQKIHHDYGGVVPELASRAHQQNIVPVIDQAIKKAGITKSEIDAIAFTRGPGLMGSLLVGVSFAKSFAQALNIPMIEVNHMRAHILAHFIEREKDQSYPSFPFLALTVSGGHTQIVLVKDFFDMEVIGQTIDDAAGEAFDKSGLLLGLDYPAGPKIDSLAKTGDPHRFEFPFPKIKGLDFSYSGLKTSILYFLQNEMAKDPNFIQANLNDLCASIQHAIVRIMIAKIKRASDELGITDIAVGGGVSANSYLAKKLNEIAIKKNLNVFIPPLQYTTDNAAMIGISAYYSYLNADFVGLEVKPDPKLKVD
jgi:N6-L-threonylcarbamoyladenine synthase